MIRHSVFALVLVGAAFAGGAAINGPGLTWLQRTILGGPTIIVDGPSDAPSMASKKANKPFPTAKTPPLVVDLPRRAPSSNRRMSRAERRPCPEAEPLLPPESPSAPASALDPRPARSPRCPIPAPLPPSRLPPVLGRAGPGGNSPEGPGRPQPQPDAQVRPRRPPRLGRASLGRRSAPPASADPPTAPAWAEIRRRMQALGIARYSMEVEVDGHVRFSCIIPVDGLRAVGHQFEAEGDDESQAAEAALRRIALWQATELPKDNSREAEDPGTDTGSAGSIDRCRVRFCGPYPWMALDDRRASLYDGRRDAPP